MMLPVLIIDAPLGWTGVGSAGVGWDPGNGTDSVGASVRVIPPDSSSSAVVGEGATTDSNSMRYNADTQVFHG